MIRFVATMLMKSLLLKYKYHFLLIVIGLSILTVLNGILYFGQQGIIYPDSESYLEAAKNLYVYHKGHHYRPIIMAAINGFPYLFGCSDVFVYEFSYYVNLFCWLATALVLFEILKQIVSEKKAFIFALFSFFFIGTLVLIYHLLSENIYMLILVLVFYFLQKYYQTKTFWNLSIALSLLVISMLIRPGSKWIAVLFVFFFLKEIFRFYKTKAALLLYGSIALVVLQFAANKYQFGNFTISYIDSITYYNYMGNKAVAYKNGTEFHMATDPRTHYIFSLQPSEIEAEAKRDLLYQLQTNKEGLFFAYCSDVYDNTISGCSFVKECRNVKNTNYFSFWQNIFFIITQWQNRIFSILGMLLATFYFFKSYRTEPFFSLIAVYIGYVIGTSGISCSQGDRFHLVFFPFVLILLAKWSYDRKII